MSAKIDRIGEISYNNQGLKMWIKEYRKSDDIDIEFEDGYVSYNKQYYMFKKGSIHNSNFKLSQVIDRTGEEKINNYGSKMTIIKYKNGSDIIVKFDNGYIKRTNYTAFGKGAVKSPYCKSLLGIGYIGEGKYNASIDGKHTQHYKYWVRMFNRCYDEKYQLKEPRYKGCTVCDEWHNFQTFSKWLDENYYEIDGQRMALDKDILVKGNKIYSPDTCCIVPQCINSIFIKNNARRGDCPLGVYYDKEMNKYRSSHTKDNIKVHSGNYDNVEDAFDSYKKGKENAIKQTADEYEDRIPKRLYNAMYKYEVEITD